MKKIIVIGCPGSGKSTFSRKLHDKIQIPLYHLDLLYWNADKTTVDKSVFNERLDAVLKKDEWIVDGNYNSSMEKRISECDTVFFLDYPLDVCLEGIKERRGKSRSDMPWIESDEDGEFIDFIKRFNDESRPAIITLLERYKFKNVIIFTDREQTNKFLIGEIK